MRKYLVILLVAAFAFVAMPAMAQAPAPAAKTVDFYGQVWFGTWMEKNDKEVVQGASAVSGQYPTKDAGYKSQDLFWSIDVPVTRLGARFKQGDFAANVEICTYDYSAGAATGYRQWWGEETFPSLGGLKLLIGHAYTPTYVPAYAMQQGGLNSYAGSFTLTGSRTSQVRFTVPTGAIGNVMVAFVKPSESLPSTATAAWSNTAFALTNYYYQMPYPKVEAVYNLDIKGDVSVKATVGGGYQVMDIYTRTATGATDSGTKVGSKIDSIKAYGFGGTVVVGVGPVTARGSAHMSKNGKEYGDNSALLPVLFIVGGGTAKVNDESNWGADGSISFKINPMFTPQAGYGMSVAEVKNATHKYESNKNILYFNVLVQMTANTLVAPELCIKDNGKFKDTVGGVTTSTKRGKETYYGAEWILSF